MPFLPTTKQELNGEQPDIILVSVDAYVDHPSFGHAIISRLIESLGFSVAVLPQPMTDDEYLSLGEPKLGFFLSGGVVDSMVNNYSVAKIKREKDSYSEGGKVGRIPDRALTFHSQNLKRIFPETPLVIGGIEASLRRFAHYDYWADKVMPTILQDCPADLLIYGMGENPVVEILELAQNGVRLDKIKDVRGTAYLTDWNSLSKNVREKIGTGNFISMPSFEEVSNDKKKYCEAFNVQFQNSDFATSKILLQRHAKKYLIVNPPQFPVSTDRLDAVYTLPYMREFHPRYKEGVPALTEVKFSLTSTRGCFGACNYCAITMHQGRLVSKRSKQSLVEEAQSLTNKKDFKGYIHDVGGPTANFRDPACKKQAEFGSCKNKTCIGFNPCQNLQVSHEEYLDILRAVRELPKVKKVFIRSGIRFDYLMLDPNCKSVLKEIVEHHISGQLKVAPEHCVDRVLKAMNKTPHQVFVNFSKMYKAINKELGKEQYIVPYLISSHPGSTTSDAVELAEYLKSIGYMPLQVQDFYPTPSTKSTTMFYTGLDPDTMQPIFVPKTKEEKRTQRALMQYALPKNYQTVKKALIETHRLDLLGYLIPKNFSEEVGEKSKQKNANSSVSLRSEKRKFVGNEDFKKTNEKKSTKSSKPGKKSYGGKNYFGK